VAPDAGLPDGAVVALAMSQPEYAGIVRAASPAASCWCLRLSVDLIAQPETRSLTLSESLVT